MIIQCDQCNAKFRLDDSKVKEGGAKVRCSKCKHVFVVQKEAPAEEADFDSLLSGLAPPSPGVSEMTGEAASPGAGRPAPEAKTPAAVEPPSTGEQEEIGFSEKEGFDFGSFEFDAGPVDTPSAAPAPDKGFDFGELDLEGAAAGSEVKTPAEGMPSFDENEFSFAEETAPPVPEFEIAIEGFEGQGIAAEAAAVTPSPPAEEDFFAGGSSQEFSFEQEAAEPQGAPSAPEPEQEPASFSFDEFEFGEAALPEKTVEGEMPGREPETPEWEMSEPSPGKTEEFEWEKPELSLQEQGTVPPVFPEVSVPPIPEMALAEEEPPSLSTPSRRKGVSILPIAVTAVSVLLVVALAVGGYYFFKEGPAAFNKLGLGFAAKWFGLDAREEGSIGVRNLVGVFLGNQEAGEIFIVNGEAVNNFAKPRASFQVKATLYGPKGEVLLQKNAYCGNALSREQLTTLPVAKLEAAMANQFGDSLSNLAVQPGKGIPFVVVFTNVPKEAADFGVEVVGSTVASQ